MGHLWHNEYRKAQTALQVHIEVLSGIIIANTARERVQKCVIVLTNSSGLSRRKSRDPVAVAVQESHALAFLCWRL